MSRVYHDDDVDLSVLEGRTIGVLGYGKQGRAQALNLRDSGCEVIVGARPGPGREQAREDGWAPVELGDAAAGSDIVLLLVPDEVQAQVLGDALAPRLRAGQSLGFATGFALHFGLVEPPPELDVIMVAPKGPGKALREEYLRGWSLMAQVAAHQDASGRALGDALAVAKGLGCTRAGVLVTTCAEEAEADLFGEQAVLCGGMVELVRAGFETLVEAGYSPEAAYIECCHELRFIVDLVQQAGLEGLYRRISPTAGYGALTRGPRVVSEATRSAMREMLAEIRSGAFAREFLAADVRGALQDAADREARHPLEVVGRRLRREMGLEGG